MTEMFIIEKDASLFSLRNSLGNCVFFVPLSNCYQLIVTLNPSLTLVRAYHVNIIIILNPHVNSYLIWRHFDRTTKYVSPQNLLRYTDERNPIRQNRKFCICGGLNPVYTWESLMSI